MGRVETLALRSATSVPEAFVATVGAAGVLGALEACLVELLLPGGGAPSPAVAMGVLLNLPLFVLIAAVVTVCLGLPLWTLLHWVEARRPVDGARVGAAAAGLVVWFPSVLILPGTEALVIALMAAAPGAVGGWLFMRVAYAAVPAAEASTSP